jgi:two-component system NtrC family response regulator
MLRHKILIVEDDHRTRRQLEWGLKDEFDIVAAGGREEGLARLRETRPGVVLLDLGLPPTPHEPDEGLRFLDEMHDASAASKALVYTGHADREHRLQAISHGAHDVLTKPVDLDALKLLVQRACVVAELEDALAREQPVVASDEEMLGSSAAMRQVVGAIRKVAATDVPVLLAGESGTGKELTAKAIHERSARKDGPFVVINCAAIPETLLEAELFGHERGSFTGAIQSRKGKVEFAQKGTLFLDEIGELPLAIQAKLLRFLQDRSFQRVGGRVTLDVDARIVAATNIDLKRAIERGAFREDLYYRLGVVTINMVPLRERGEDALVIARVFLKRVRAQMRKPIRGFTPQALRAIEAYAWPGNVRELSNKIRRAVALAEGRYLTPEDLDIPVDAVAVDARPPTLREARERLEADMARRTLARYNWNLSRVAEELGITRPTLYALIRKHRFRETGATKV